MARIKAVINERRLAYEGAVQLAEEQREDHFDKLVLKHQELQLDKGRKQRRQRKAQVATKRITEVQSAQENTGSESVIVADMSPATPSTQETRPPRTS